MQNEERRLIRVFISSPGDVTRERKIARDVIDSLRPEFSRHFDIESVLWEDHPLKVSASFQEGIDAILKTKPIDVAVFILWSRLGTPLHSNIVKADGSNYRSGTEREFDLMYRAWRESGEKRPQILAYARDDRHTFLDQLKNVDEEAEQDARLQRDLAKLFLRERFVDEDGHNVGAYHGYKKPKEFRERLETHLRELFAEFAGEVASTSAWKDLPYRGLQIYDKEHMPIFFGRETEIRRVASMLRKLGQKAANDSETEAFLLLVGASGAGKSSLARAGVANHMERETSGPWHSIFFRYADFVAQDLNPFELLAKLIINAFNQDSSLSLEEFAELLKARPSLAIDSFLTRIEASLDEEHVRLLLIWDQFEELWQLPEVSEEKRSELIGLLRELSKTGRLVVLATIRSDYYGIAQSMIANLPRFDLLTPRPSALRRIISEPARMAGLQFEEHTETKKTLDEQLVDDALGDPLSLPLLQYVLFSLHNRLLPDEETTLRFSDYSDLGGLRGAIGEGANNVFASLPEQAKSALGAILPELVAIKLDSLNDSNHDGEQVERKAIRRWASLQKLRANDEAAQLTDALIEARFLTVSDDKAELAHDSLLTEWPHARKWIADNSRQLALKNRVDEQRKAWDLGQDDSLLLGRGVQLEEGKQLLNLPSEFIEPETRTFVRESISAVRQAMLWQVLKLASIALGVAVLVGFIGYSFNRSTRARGYAQKLVGADAATFRDARRNVSKEVIRNVEDTVKASLDPMESFRARIVLTKEDPDECIPLLLSSFFKDEHKIDVAFLPSLVDAVIESRSQKTFLHLAQKEFESDETTNYARFRAGLCITTIEKAVGTGIDWSADEFRFMESQVEKQPLLDVVQYAKTLAGTPKQLASLVSLPDLRAWQFDAILKDITDDEPLLDELALLVQERSKKANTTEPEDLSARLGRYEKGSISAIALLRLGGVPRLLKAFQALYSKNDGGQILAPDLTTFFLAKLRDRGVSLRTVCNVLEQHDLARQQLKGEDRKAADYVMYLLVLCLGEFEIQDLPREESNKLIKKIEGWYRSDKSSSIHGATGWLLSNWGRDDIRTEIDSQPVNYDGGRQEWFIEKLRYGKNESESMCATFVVFRPATVDIGSLVTDTGAIYDPDEQQYKVHFKKHFAISDRELTWVESDKLSAARDKAKEVNVPQEYLSVGSAYPIVCADWGEATKFCDSLRAPPSENVLYRLFAPRTKFRLPAEAEWERACRSGTSSLFSFGDNPQMLDRFGWHMMNSSGKLQQVGRLRPNARGIFDMHGNVYEWCLDYYHHKYDVEARVNDVLGPTVQPPPKKGKYYGRVTRGGSVRYPSTTARSALRDQTNSTTRIHNLGFRLACTITEPDRNKLESPSTDAE